VIPLWKALEMTRKAVGKRVWIAWNMFRDCEKAEKRRM